MPDVPSTLLTIREWAGLYNTVDRFELPKGAMVIQDNVQALNHGLLRVRPGLRPLPGYDFEAEIVPPLFNYDHPSGDRLIAVTVDGDLKWRSATGGGTLQSGLPVDNPWSFAKARNGDLIGVYGLGQRGIRWDGQTAEAEQLGITAPGEGLSVTAPPPASDLLLEYGCAVRYIDDESPKPIESSLGPEFVLDAESGGPFTWTGIPQPVEPRVVKIELWRSLGNQRNIWYRVGTVDVGTTSFTESLTDEELIESGFEDEFNRTLIIAGRDTFVARRHGVPPSNKSVVVHFQDRMFYLVDREPEEPEDVNQIWYSGVDEPESVFVARNAKGQTVAADKVSRQINVNDTDELVAAAPFSAILYVFSDRFVYGLDYARQPKVDQSFRLQAHRGLVGPYAWDNKDLEFYAIDQEGCYMMGMNFQVQPISDPVQSYFRETGARGLDFSKRLYWHTNIDGRYDIVRFFMTFNEETSERPKQALCYNKSLQSWWVEKYPIEITSSSKTEIGGDFQSVFAGKDGKIYTLDAEGVDELPNLETPITYKLRTRVFRWLDLVSNQAADMNNERAFKLIHKPNTPVTVTLRQYENRERFPVEWGVSAISENIETVKGSPDATLDLNNTYGFLQHRFSSKREGWARGEYFTEFELEGQGAAGQRIVFNEFHLAGVTQ